MADVIDEAKKAAKKGAKVVGDAYNNLPSAGQIADTANTVASSLQALRDMQIDPGRTAPPADPFSLYGILSKAQGYYRGYIKPKIDSAVRDVQQAIR